MAGRKSDVPDVEKPRHPIGLVSRRTGIPPDLLRAWERRYDAVSPGRAPAGRRLYSDRDIERLRLLRRVVEAGRRISDVAPLSIEELERLALEDQAASIEMPGAGPTQPTPDARALLAESLDAVAALDRVRLERTLASAAVILSRPLFRQQYIVPLMREVGERWHDGTLRIMHEHLASAVIRTILGMLAYDVQPFSTGGSRIVVTTPAGQMHEIGALLAASAAAEQGWDVIYLGPNLPMEEIAAAVRQNRAQALALSLVYPPDDPKLPGELRRLRDHVGPEVAIFLGGTAVSSYGAVIAEIGAVRFEDFADFQRHLESRIP